MEELIRALTARLTSSTLPLYLADAVPENAAFPYLTAEVVSPFSYENGSEYVQGVADITAGVDLTDGTNIEKNHMLVVPSGGDGRGILVTSEDAYILVRGEYYIVD